MQKNYIFLKKCIRWMKIFACTRLIWKSKFSYLVIDLEIHYFPLGFRRNYLTCHFEENQLNVNRFLCMLEVHTECWELSIFNMRLNFWTCENILIMLSTCDQHAINMRLTCDQQYAWFHSVIVITKTKQRQERFFLAA